MGESETSEPSPVLLRLMHSDLRVDLSGLWRLLQPFWFPSLQLLQTFLDEVVLSPVDLKPLNLGICMYRNIKLLGDGLTAFTFNMFAFETFRLLWTLLSVAHTISHVN